MVRLTDSSGSPFDVRLTHIRSNASDHPEPGAIYVAGAHRRSPETPADSEILDSVGGNVLIGIAIAGALLIVVYVGRVSVRATATVPGTLCSPVLNCNQDHCRA